MAQGRTVAFCNCMCSSVHLAAAVFDRAPRPSGPSRLFDDSIGALEELVFVLVIRSFLW
jgi:hypothetical protein